MTTKPLNARCSTSRFAAICAIMSSASCTRLRPLNLIAKAKALATSAGSAGVSFLSSAMVYLFYRTAVLYGGVMEQSKNVLQALVSWKALVGFQGVDIKGSGWWF